MDRNPLLTELAERGLLVDCTDLDGLSRRLSAGPTKIYIGFDPTADSLHVGSLMPLRAARLIQDHGHVPVLLIGGATGMIGDPSGRSSERAMLDDVQLDLNRAGLQRQITMLVPAEAGAVEVVDNRDWVGPMSAIELLRDVGRHFSVSSMLAKDSVKLRRDSESGLTFTEFAYQVLQSFDFWWLRVNMDVEVQAGGSDQWGNITAGIDFMRRKDGSTGFGLVWPLLTKADGSKFGKSADANVWLDSRRTSVFDFWQFWLHTDDADVETMLLRFGSLHPVAIAELMVAHRADPSRRLAQRVLADDVTTWVHGAVAARNAGRTAAIVFGSAEGGISELDLDALELHLGATRLPADQLVGMQFADLAVRSRLCGGHSAAIRLIAGGGLSINGRVIAPAQTVSADDIDHGFALLRRGRRTVALVRVDTCDRLVGAVAQRRPNTQEGR